MKIDRSNPQHWLLLLAQGAYALLGILYRAITPKPRTPLIVFYGHQFSGNIKALYEKTQNSGAIPLDSYCLFLDPEAATAAESKGVSVLRCYRLQDMLKVARAAVIVTDHGLHALLPLLRFTGITFIDVWHGIPFKGFSPQDFSVLHDYDEVWVSSPLLRELYIDRFGFSHEKVHSLGYARADKLFQKKTAETSFKESRNIAQDKRLVLYAPTWEHDDKSRSQMPFGQSADSFYSSLGATCAQSRAVLVVRSHLNTSITQGEFDNVLFCPMADFPDTESLLQETDVLLCDWSSIAFDFLATHRPTLFLDVRPPFKEGFSLGPQYRFGAVVSDFDTLNAQLDKALSMPQHYWGMHEDAHQSVTAAVYGETSDGQAGARQLERLLELAGKR